MMTVALGRCFKMLSLPIKANSIINQCPKSHFSASNRLPGDFITDISSQTSNVEVHLMRKYKRRLEMILDSTEGDENLSRVVITNVGVSCINFLQL